ncbi:MAG: LysR family transcriptional regulator [Proteobacteria bacterium]|nr:LysR family transcriptional regulator [Pseudomonadota bacterium]
MRDFDWLDIDARLLRLLVAVVDAGGITGAAQELGVTQSAVSHQLEKLRAITQDPLFVKSGRGVAPTARAQALAAQARELLRQLQDFAQTGAFVPAHWRGCVTIAAGDFQREVLLPALARTLRAQAPGLALRIIASNVPSLEMLRDGACDIAISPRPPDGSDIMQKRLFSDSYSVYYDAAARAAPASLEEYLGVDHATVVYEPYRALAIDRTLEAQGLHRRFAVMVPGFAALPAFVRGSPLLATAPQLLHRSLLRGLATCAVPTPTPAVQMYMIWHRRHQEAPPHRWLRQCLEAAAQLL